MDPVTDAPQSARPVRVAIEYCPRCGWLLRAAWLAQELLSTFGGDLEEVALRPAGSGVFRVVVDGLCVWDRTADAGFPQAAELKRRLRDVAFPDRALGHADGGG